MTLAHELDRYLSVRRSLGYDLATAERALRRFVQYADDKGVHPATLALAWVMGNEDVTAPIIGGRDLDQLQPSLDALDFEMSAQMRAEIGALSIEPPSATDRAETQA